MRTAATLACKAHPSGTDDPVGSPAVRLELESETYLTGPAAAEIDSAGSGDPAEVVVGDVADRVAKVDGVRDVSKGRFHP